MRLMSNRRIVVYPSELHEYAYCPRYYFFHTHIGRKPTLREKIRMFIGKLFHFVKGVPDLLRGRRVEETIEVSIGSGVVLRGRPDSYEVRTDREVLVIERKSGRGPKKGVWVSDSSQASAYAFMLARLLGVSNASIRIEYATKSRSSKLDEEKITRLLKLIDEIILVREHGIVPYPKRGPRKCARCPFKDICDELDREEIEELYEPGYWLKEINIDETFR